MANRTQVKIGVVKTLFALSCNTCALPRCEAPLAKPEWPTVMAEIAHIRGLRAGSARFDAEYKNCDDLENLLLVCPACHKLIDELEPEAYPVDRLLDIKARHDQACGKQWAGDDILHRFALLALGSSNDSQHPYELTIRRPRSHIHVENKSPLVVEGLTVSFRDREDAEEYAFSTERLVPGITWIIHEGEMLNLRDGDLVGVSIDEGDGSASRWHQPLTA